MRKLQLVALMALIAGSAYAQHWDVGQTEDLMSGTSQTLVIGTAEASRGTLRDASLIIRYGDGPLELFVHWGGYSMDRSGVMVVKLGDEDPQRIRGTLSTNRNATFFPAPRQMLAQILALGPEGRVVIQAERTTNVMSTARWIVGDLAEHVELDR